MRSCSPTLQAGLLSFLPLTATRPSAIQRSASLREHRPARASRLAIRSPATSVMGSAAGGNERVEDAVVAGADRIFGVPLHAEAEAPLGDLDALDHAVGRQCIDR